MKIALLLAMFVFSAFIISCGKSNMRDCHHYYGSDWWDDPLYLCRKSEANQVRQRLQQQKTVEESSYRQANLK